MAGASIGVGITTDIILKTEAFSIYLRLLGVGGIILSHFPLKRTGKLLRLLGNPTEWGGTSRLITTDIYKCVRHPHHLGVGIFMTSLGLVIGHLWSFLFISISQWVWVILFLFLVEEQELTMKFGKEFEEYRQKTPMLFANPLCVFRVLSKPIIIDNKTAKDAGIVNP